MTFPEFERTIYSKTFLKDVRLRLYVNGGVAPDENAIKEFFLKRFGDGNIPIDELRGGICFTSNTSPMAVTMDYNSFEVRISRPLYKRFEQVQEWMPAMIEYLHALGTDLVSRCMIIKYNELDFTHPKLDFPVSEVMKQVLSYNLTSSVEEDDYNKFGDLSRWEKKLDFDEINEEKYRGGIEFGFRRKPNAERLDGSITLKTFIFLGKEMASSEAAERIAAMNRVIDDMFHWSVNESIINNMK